MGVMRLFYVAIEKNAEGFEFYKDLWQAHNISGIMAETMSEGIEKAVEIEKSPNNELYFIDIVADDIDYMPQLKILSEETEAPILIATFNSDNDEHHEALNNGADFYGEYCETTEQNIEGVISFINSMNRRSRGKNNKNELIFYESILISPAHRHVFVNDVEAGLTKTEFDVLYFLMINRGFAMKFEQIYDRIWGETKLDKSVKQSVKTIIKKIRVKIGESVIESVRGIGYRVPT